MELPGFVDLQVNGYAGVDFLVPETSVDDILRAADLLRRRGTAGFLLTVTTNSRNHIETNIAHARQAMDRQGPDGPILGIHLEGPFISPEYGFRGAHMEKYIIAPDLDWFRRLQDLARGAIRLVTVAPEIEGCIGFIAGVADHVLVAIGHANPDYDQLRAAVNAGLRLVTHFGNGVRPEIDRHRNILVNELACPELSLCLISDGHHLPEAFLRMLLHRVPVRNLVVTSDTVMYAGLEPGYYEREATKLRLRADGRLCLADDEKLLYGSSMNILECVNCLAGLGLLDEDELCRVAFDNPLRLLGMDPASFRQRTPRIRFDPPADRFELMGAEPE